MFVPDFEASVSVPTLVFTFSVVELNMLRMRSSAEDAAETTPEASAVSLKREEALAMKAEMAALAQARSRLTAIEAEPMEPPVVRPEPEEGPPPPLPSPPVAPPAMRLTAAEMELR